MSSLATRFTGQMRKRAMSSQGESALGSEVPGGKGPKWSGPDGEAQDNPTIINVDY